MSRSHKLLSFEGMRGIAAIVVVIWHLRLTFCVDSPAEIRACLAFLPYILSRPITAVIEASWNGPLAVWLFWIMSAFVLSLQFFLRANETTGAHAHNYLEEAFLRRYPRLLLPVAASVAFAFSLQSLGWMRNADLAHAFGEPATAWLSSWYAFPPNWFGAVKSAVWQSFFSYDSSSSYNSVLWTMEKEFYGSLFLFSFLGLLGHRRSRFLVYPLIVLIDAKFRLHWLNAFVAGIALCDLFVNRSKFLPARSSLRWSALHHVRHSHLLAVVLWGLIILGAGLPNYRGVFYLILGSCAVALTLISTSTQRILSKRIPVFLGRISFGLYLIHFPLICSFSCWAYLRIAASTGAHTAVFLVSMATFALSIALGYGFYLVADRPSLTFSRWLSSHIMGKDRADSSNR